MWSDVRLYTVGHSTRPLEELVELLRSFDVRTLVDVRTVPRSRRHPQFNADALAESLPPLHVEYAPLKALGGLRKAKKDSANMAWRNESFRGYADYMQTPEFLAGLDALYALASSATA